MLHCVYLQEMDQEKGPAGFSINFGPPNAEEDF